VSRDGSDTELSESIIARVESYRLPTPSGSGFRFQGLPGSGLVAASSHAGVAAGGTLLVPAERPVPPSTAPRADPAAEKRDKKEKKERKLRVSTDGGESRSGSGIERKEKKAKKEKKERLASPATASEPAVAVTVSQEEDSKPARVRSMELLGAPRLSFNRARASMAVVRA
jgi:hypothetical protein